LKELILPTGNTLAPSVSGSLWAKPGCCGCPAWQSCHWLLSCVAA